MDNDEGPGPNELGDAAAFGVNKSTDGALRLRTIRGYNYNKTQYKLYLVACDGNYQTRVRAIDHQ